MMQVETSANLNAISVGARALHPQRHNFHANDIEFAVACHDSFWLGHTWSWIGEYTASLLLSS